MKPMMYVKVAIRKIACKFVSLTLIIYKFVILMIKCKKYELDGTFMYVYCC